MENSVNQGPARRIFVKGVYQGTVYGKKTSDLRRHKAFMGTKSERGELPPDVFNFKELPSFIAGQIQR